MNKIVCPYCGSDDVVEEKRRLGCLWFILIRPYVAWRVFNILIGLILFIVWDWWFAIIMMIFRKPYEPICKYFFIPRKNYICCNCKKEFRE